MFRPIPRLWDLVPSFDIRATENSLAIKIGNNKLLRTELRTIVHLGHLFLEARDFFYTTLHKSRVQRAVLKQNYQQRRGQIIAITPTAWCILVLINVMFSPLTFAGIAMVFWLLATWLVLYASYETAQIISRVTSRLLDGPVQNFMSTIWKITRSGQPLTVSGGSVPPRIQLNMQPNTPERGLQSPLGYEQMLASWCEGPVPPRVEQPIPRGRTPPSGSGAFSESAGDMFRRHGQLPRPASLGPLPKARKRAAKAIMNRRVLEGN